MQVTIGKVSYFPYLYWSWLCCLAWRVSPWERAINWSNARSWVWWQFYQWSWLSIGSWFIHKWLTLCSHVWLFFCSHKWLFFCSAGGSPLAPPGSSPSAPSGSSPSTLRSGSHSAPTSGSPSDPTSGSPSSPTSSSPSSPTSSSLLTLTSSASHSWLGLMSLVSHSVTSASVNHTKLTHSSETCLPSSSKTPINYISLQIHYQVLLSLLQSLDLSSQPF